MQCNNFNIVRGIVGNILHGAWYFSWNSYDGDEHFDESVE